MKFHHIGIAVSDIDEVSKDFIFSEYKPISGKVYDGAQKATLQMFDWNGKNVELVDGQVVKSVLNGGRFKIYHVCLEVDSLIDMIDRARCKGYIQITGINPAPLFDNRLVVFMTNNEGFMIEFLEAEKKERVRI
jgi:catechol 2,3-dioxygenase-like lactoylglutathione lyase family enzyme